MYWVDVSTSLCLICVACFEQRASVLSRSNVYFHSSNSGYNEFSLYLCAGSKVLLLSEIDFNL